MFGGGSLEELVKQLGVSGVTIFFMWQMLRHFMKKLDEKDLKITSQEDKLEKSGDKMVELLTGVIQHNTDALHQNTEIIRELKVLLEKRINTL